MTPPRGMADCAIRQRLSSSLTLFLAANWRGGFHASVGAFAGDDAARHRLGVAGVDRRPQRARGAEGEPAELQPRRGGGGALLDQIGRHRTHLGVFFVLQHLEAVDDRADRRDHVVANPRAQQRGEVHRGEGDHCHWNFPVAVAAEGGADEARWAAGAIVFDSPSAPRLGDERKRRKEACLNDPATTGRLDLAKRRPRRGGAAACARRARRRPGGDGRIRARRPGARQGRRQSGDRRRRAGRGDDPRAFGGLGGADPDRRRRGDRRRRADRHRGTVRPGRSARRDARIHRPQRRVHRQRRAHRTRPADRRRGLCAGARTAVVRRRARFRLRSAGRRRPAAAAGLARAERPRRSAGAHRARQPLAWRRRDGSLPRRPADRRSPLGRLVAEILRHRRGRRRRLSALRADDGMGHRRRRRGPARRGRSDACRRGRAAALRQDRRRACATAASSPGATRAPRRAPLIVNGPSIGRRR